MHAQDNGTLWLGTYLNSQSTLPSSSSEIPTAPTFLSLTQLNIISDSDMVCLEAFKSDVYEFYHNQDQRDVHIWGPAIQEGATALPNKETPRQLFGGKTRFQV